MADEDPESAAIRAEVREATRALDVSIDRLVRALGWAEGFARGVRRPTTLAHLVTPAPTEPRTRFLE